METTDHTPDEQEEVADHPRPVAGESEDQAHSDSAQSTKPFEATIVELDREAAESLLRRAGMQAP